MRHTKGNVDPSSNPVRLFSDIWIHANRLFGMASMNFRTPLERSGPKNYADPRYSCVQIFYGDPIRDKKVKQPNPQFWRHLVSILSLTHPPQYRYSRTKVRGDQSENSLPWSQTRKGQIYYFKNLHACKNIERMRRRQTRVSQHSI